MAISTGAMSNYLEDKIIRHMLTGVEYRFPEYYEDYNYPYLGVHTSPTGAGEGNTGTEKTGGYAEFSRYRVDWVNEWQVSNDIMVNTVTAHFAKTSNAWGTIYGWGIYDQYTGGNLLFWGLFDVPVYVGAGEILKIPAGKMRIGFSQPNALNGGWTSFSTTKMAEWIVEDIPFDWTLAGTKIVLLSAITTSGSNNLTGYTEISGAGYAPIFLPTSTWKISAENIATNINPISFSTSVTESWGTITDILLFDNDTGDNPMFWGHLPTPITVNIGDGFKIPADGLQVSFLIPPPVYLD